MSHSKYHKDQDEKTHNVEEIHLSGCKDEAGRELNDYDEMHEEKDKDYYFMDTTLFGQLKLI